MATSFETVRVTTRSVSCDGGKGAAGHPNVFLQIPPTENEVVCPYCSKKFVLKNSK